MLNILGLSISFIGTIISVLNVLKGKPTKEGTTWEHLEQIAPNEEKNKSNTKVGIGIMGVGFLLQLIAAIINY